MLCVGVAGAADPPKLVPENLALGKPATASSSQRDEGHSPANATDGDPGTRWCADGPDPGAWWQVDLGRTERLAGCRIAWEFEGKPYAYRVEGSADGKTWATLADRPNGTTTHALTFAGTARYVRVTVSGLPDGGWPSFYDFELFGRRQVAAPPTRPTVPGAKAPPGFDLTLFAGPPNVSYPTCLAAAPGGDVFVGVDLNGSLDRSAGRGKVVRCRDTDGDGAADQFVTFCEPDSPRGIWWDNNKTLIVLHPPFLTAYTDDDGDGKADQSEHLVTGLGFDLNTRGADHTTNGFRVGIDGYLYIAVGDYGAVRAVGKDGRAVQLRGGVVRVRTDGTGLEVVSRGQRNIYDVAVSPTLDLFTRDNTNDGDGWDVRLSHVVLTGQYGYPTLFKNFAEDIVRPLADYGGGAPCGALYLDEPGFPGGTGTGLYTVDWGRGGVFRHPLTPNGASWTAGQEMFLQVPRPTDLDADGVGHLYVSSWNDGGFTYSGPAVGYVARLTPTAVKPSTFRDLAKASDDELLKALGSPSGVRRLYASREVIARGDRPGAADGLFRLAAGDAPLSARVAAVFTLRQLRGPKAADDLARLAKFVAIREFALKALADDPASIRAGPFLAGAADPDPRVRVVAAFGLGRHDSPDGPPALLPLVADSDPVVAHVAVNALVARRAVGVCLKALDGSQPPGVVRGALRALRRMHDPAAVDGLIARLGAAKDEPLRRGILVALARLYRAEAGWDGTWWGTRPDTTGPYYNPTPWAETARIGAVLKKSLADADAAEVKWLVAELTRHRVDLPEVSAAVLKLADSDPAFRPAAFALLAAGTPPAAAVPLFAAFAADPAADPTVRAKAVRGLLKVGGNDSARSAAVAALTAGHKLPGPLESMWTEYARDGGHVADVSAFVTLAKAGTPPQRELAFGVLATVADRPLGAKDARAAAASAVATGLADPAAAPLVLKAVARLGLTAYAPQIRPLMMSKHGAVAAAATAALKAMKLDAAAASGTAPVIGSLAFETVLATAVRQKGMAELGGKLFERVGCVNCHTVSANEPLKGPMLAGITTRYNRAELVESILKPSAKIAQGFESVTFVTADGKTVTGFVVREGGTEVEVRDGTGAASVLRKEDIDERRPSKLSVMPERLVDHLTPNELASILAYLESLSVK